MMRYVLERVVDPAIEPVDLAAMKRHLREFEDVSSSDGDISDLIVSAREWAEDYTGRALIDQTWRLSIDQTGNWLGDSVAGYVPRSGYDCGRFHWVSRVGEIYLRKSPVLSIVSFVTVDDAGAETAIDAATYELREVDSKWPRLVALSGATWTASNLRITFRAGYANLVGSPEGTEADVPARFRQAIKLHAEAHYDRDAVMMQKLLDAAENLIRPERSEIGFA